MCVHVSRRGLLSTVAAGLLAACTADRSRPSALPSDAQEDRLRLTARPDLSAPASLQPGRTSVQLLTRRTALLHVPPGPTTALPPDRPHQPRVVPVLQRARYNVDYREFDESHVVPSELAEQAADWLAG